MKPNPFDGVLPPPAPKAPRSPRYSIRASALTPIYGPLCFYCLAAPGTTADHLIPRSVGGRTTIENMVPCCLPCNQAKDNRMPTTNDLARARECLRQWRQRQP